MTLTHHWKEALGFKESFMANLPKYGITLDETRQKMYAAKFEEMVTNFKNRYVVVEPQPLPTMAPRQKKSPTLPSETLRIIQQEESLLVDFNKQGVSLHNLTFEQKKVAARLEQTIVLFNKDKITENPTLTIKALDEVKKSHKTVNKNIEDLNHEEKEIGELIKRIMERQQFGNKEKLNIDKEIKRLTGVIETLQKRIVAAQTDLNRVKGELDQLRHKIAVTEAKMVERRIHKKFWLIVAFLAGGAVTAVNELENTKMEWDQTYRALGRQHQLIANLQGDLLTTFGNHSAEKDGLENRQFELGKLDGSLKRVQYAQHNIVKYRQYLLHLSDAFNKVITHVDSLQLKLEDVNKIQEYGAQADEFMKKGVNESCIKLETTWNRAKKKPALEVALGVQNDSTVDDTLRAITKL